MDGGIMLILLLLVLNKKREEKISTISNKQVNELMNPNSFTLNIPYTRDKIKIMKKIGPYFPQEYISPINKSITITEKIIKLFEAVDFMETPQINYIEPELSVANNKERISYIMNTIKNEVSKEEIKDMGLVLDIILNMDKYKNLFTILNSIITDPNSLNEPNKIIKLIEPLMEGKDEKEKEKMKEMMKMLEIMKTLDIGKKDSHQS